ncbi:MAG: moderate conductance mechanosensitive channel, partial [Rhodospirillaceae bacterium]|nr:moderate conductance mechanosensitive channel [Rhodospirillaceae bacterium]
MIRAKKSTPRLAGALRCRLRSIAAAMSVLLASAVTAYAQVPAAPPAGMTQEQFDSLVDAISNSVTEKLKAEGVPAAPARSQAAQPKAGKGAPAATPKPMIVITAIGDEPDAFGLFFERAKGVARALPILGTQLAVIPGLLDQRSTGGRGTSAFVLLLGLIAVVAVAAEAMLRRILGKFRAQLAVGAGPDQGMRSLIHLGLLALMDALGVFVVWLICHGAVGAWFTGATGQDKLAVAVLFGIFGWRLYVLLFRIVLQPDMPNARLCDVRDHDARAMYARISLVMLLIILGRTLGQVLIAIRTPPEGMAAYQIIVLLIYLSAFIWLVVRSRDAARQWLGGLGTVAPLASAVGRNWTPVAISFFVALAATQAYGAISGRQHVASTMLLTLNLVVGVVIFETLLQAFVRRLDSQLVGRTPASDAPKLPDVVARCVRVAVLIGVAVTIAESWVVEVFGLASESEWDQITRSSRTAGITLFLAFVIWELFKYATDPYMEHKTKSAAEAIAGGDAAGPPASRLSTMMPLLRMAMMIVIGVIAVLVALQDFGVNITPLIAGASVLGLAVSFGSQTLVKDIVSGVFYLSDDAFRVGEYIDCGKAKGTVEGFTLRSIKLRHQNGPVHTIPFGQLGQITNFSRDWSTVKFNLRFARDTDLEK